LLVNNRIFYCRVTTFENLEYLILQTHVKTKEEFRTIIALGTNKKYYLVLK